VEIESSRIREKRTRLFAIEIETRLDGEVKVLPLTNRVYEKGSSLSFYRFTAALLPTSPPLLDYLDDVAFVHRALKPVRSTCAPRR
jgi:hypothetical protein